MGIETIITVNTKRTSSYDASNTIDEKRILDKEIVVDAENNDSQDDDEDDDNHRFVNAVLIKIRRNNRNHETIANNTKLNEGRRKKDNNDFIKLLNQYDLKEEEFYKSWFDRKVKNSERNAMISSSADESD